MFVLIVLGVIFAGLAIFVLIQPDEFTVTRSASMNASPDKIFPLVNDLQQWHRWSPWAKLDPNAKIRFEGPLAGVGAVMRWQGNPKVGTGRMTITESRPDESIRLKLDFIKPMKAASTGTFHFRAMGIHTEVTWSLHGTSNFIGKAMGLILNYDTMIGGQYEKGLASIKVIAEGAEGAKPAGIIMPARIVTLPEAAKSSVVVKSSELSSQKPPEPDSGSGF